MEIKYIKLGVALYLALMAAIGTEKAISFYIIKEEYSFEKMIKDTIFKNETKRMELQAKIEREKNKKCLNYIKPKND